MTPPRPQSEQASDPTGRGEVPASESVHPASRELHRLAPDELLALFEEEDSTVAGAVRDARDCIAALGLAMSEALTRGGRIFFVGAGTSGRLGALDAAEWEPTFGCDRSRLVPVVAGGSQALQRAVEGAEDRGEEATSALAQHGLAPSDLVLGISASGAAEFVQTALREARELGCSRAFVTSHAGSLPDDSELISVVLPTGREIVAGSTRLKAALATHMVLQRASNVCAVAQGWVYRGHMVEMRPTNRKLRARAVRIVSEVALVDGARAALELERSGDDIKVAIVSARLGLSPDEARRRLEAVDRYLPRIEEFS